jgi:hypothetical protein
MKSLSLMTWAVNRLKTQLVNVPSSKQYVTEVPLGLRNLLSHQDLDLDRKPILHKNDSPDNTPKHGSHLSFVATHLSSASVHKGNKNWNQKYM